MYCECNMTHFLKTPILYMTHTHFNMPVVCRKVNCQHFILENVPYIHMYAVYKWPSSFFILYPFPWSLTVLSWPPALLAWAQQPLKPVCRRSTRPTELLSTAAQEFLSGTHVQLAPADVTQSLPASSASKSNMNQVSTQLQTLQGPSGATNFHKPPIRHCTARTTEHWDHDLSQRGSSASFSSKTSNNEVDLGSIQHSIAWLSMGLFTIGYCIESIWKLFA